MKEEIWDPSCRTAVRMEDSVCLDHGDEHRRRECELRIVETWAHISDNINNGLPWLFGGIGIISNLLVGRFEIVLPRGVDVGQIAVISNFENQKADVVVRCRICEAVE